MPPDEDDDIDLLRLGAREEKKLRLVGVWSVQDFLHLDLARVRCVRDCGPAALRRLSSAQARLRRRCGCRFAERTLAATRARRHKFVRRPLARDSWQGLPFFSGNPFPGVKPAELHESYRPHLPLDRPVEFADLKKTFDGSGMTTLGELLLTPWPKLIGCGRKALTRMHHAVRDFLTRWLDGPLPRALDTSSPEAFLASLVERGIENERERLVVLERMGWRSEPCTLKDIGGEIGCTRERVRQIEQRGLKKLEQWDVVESLKPLHDLLLEMCRNLAPHKAMDNKGLDKLCEAIQRHYGWSRPLPRAALVAIAAPLSGRASSR